MARSSALRAYSHIYDAAVDDAAPLAVTPGSRPGCFSVATFRKKYDSKGTCLKCGKRSIAVSTAAGSHDAALAKLLVPGRAPDVVVALSECCGAPLDHAPRGEPTVRASRRYLVEYPGRSGRPWCSCPWFSDPRNETLSCKHVELVRQALYIRQGLGTPLPVADPSDLTRLEAPRHVDPGLGGAH